MTRPALDQDSALELLASDEERWPAHLAELSDTLMIAAQRGGLDRPTARRIAAHQTLGLLEMLGGTRYRWPTPSAIERPVRDLLIWSMHDGTTDGPNGIYRLAQRHRITAECVWAIIRKQRKLHRHRSEDSRR